MRFRCDFVMGIAGDREAYLGDLGPRRGWLNQKSSEGLAKGRKSPPSRVEIHAGVGEREKISTLACRSSPRGLLKGRDLRLACRNPRKGWLKGHLRRPFNEASRAFFCPGRSFNEALRAFCPTTAHARNPRKVLLKGSLGAKSWPVAQQCSKRSVCARACSRPS
jgi:hypothetical protein